MMELLRFLVVVGTLYAAGYCVDTYLKARSPTYDVWTKRRGWNVGFMSVKCYTKWFNSLLNLVGAKYCRLQLMWFDVGTLITALAVLPSMLLLIYTAATSLNSLILGTENEAVLQPVLPGMNLPRSEMIHYFLTLAVCTIVHETGHALAAVSQQVPLLAVGLMLLFILPAAFVEIPTSCVTSLTPWKQLRIYCAGVWHNLVLSLAAFLALSFLPLLVYPLFVTGSGITVYGIHQDYVDSGSHWFQPGDQLIAIDRCQLTNTTDWRNCLMKIRDEPQLGFCTAQGFLPESQPEQRDQCCQTELNQSHLCFTADGSQQSYCLRARLVAESSSGHRCRDQSSCGLGKTCLKPVLTVATNISSRLLEIERRLGQPVLYIGQVEELFATIYVSDYVARTSFMSTKIVHFSEQLLRYLVSFSAGLALLNVVPCVAMDGQYIARALIQLVPQSLFPGRFKNALSKVVIMFGSCLVFANIVLGLFTLFIT